MAGGPIDVQQGDGDRPVITYLRVTNMHFRSTGPDLCIADRKAHPMIQRNIQRITTAPFHPGFLGEGHRAAAVVDGQDFPRTDPFIILMDDRLDLPGGEPVGGPHPHAGFETATFVLQGSGAHWPTGSYELMTAGKGIVHTEEITDPTNVRILQLWLALPPEQRWAEPRWQRILVEQVPTHRTDGAEVRVYSGSSHGFSSPIRNHTPFTLLDVHLRAGSSTTLEVPAAYRGFLLMIDGTVDAAGTELRTDQAGWLDAHSAEDTSAITLRAITDARVLLYAARPHGAPIVSHGPFIGDSQADIMRLYQEYRQGKMPHLNDLAQDRKALYDGADVQFDPR
ncbi:MAG TPA: pirin-like C-terminal cupin domain-containing protein [Flavobacteriales bacterium]